MPGIPPTRILRSHQASYATQSKATTSPVPGRWHGVAALGCAMGLMVTLALLGWFGPSSTLLSLSRLSVHVTAPKVAYFRVPNARIVKGMGGNPFPTNKATHSNSRYKSDLGHHVAPRFELQPTRPGIMARAISFFTPGTSEMWKSDFFKLNSEEESMIPSVSRLHWVSLCVLSILLPVGFWRAKVKVAMMAVKAEDQRERICVRTYQGEPEPLSSSDLSPNEQQSTGKAILRLAIPALAGLAIDPLMTIADTAFVGRTSANADALAGLGSAAALLTFSFYLFNFLCTVTTPLVSKRRAGGDDAGAAEIGGQALSFAIILGVLLSSALMGFSQPLLDVMGTGNTGIKANQYATDFLNGRAIAAPAVFIISAATGILRGYLDTKSVFVILLGANFVNLALDVVLILGLDMGPQGAAVATTTAEWICAVSLLLILAGKAPSVDGILGSNQQSRRQENSGDQTAPLLELEKGNHGDKCTQPGREFLTVTPTLEMPTWDALQPLLVASSSVFVRSFMLQLSIVGAAAMAARSGGDISSEASSASIAAHQIALQLWLLCSFVCDALAAASQALVADGIGNENPKEIREVSNTIFVYSLGLGVFLATALTAGDASGLLLNLFTTDEATQDALRPLLAILIVAQPLNAFVFAADGVLQGASAFSYQAKSMILSVSVAFGSFFGLQYFVGGGELTTIWYSLVILQLMRGLTSMWKLVDTQGPIDLLARAVDSPSNSNPVRPGTKIVLWRGEGTKGYSTQFRHLELHNAYVACMHHQVRHEAAKDMEVQMEFQDATRTVDEDDDSHGAMQYVTSMATSSSSSSSSEIVDLDSDTFVRASQRTSLLREVYSVISVGESFDDLVQGALESDDPMLNQLRSDPDCSLSWCVRLWQYGNGSSPNDPQAKTESKQAQRVGMSKRSSMNREKEAIAAMQPLLEKLHGRVRLKNPDCALHVLQGLNHADKILVRNLVSGPATQSIAPNTRQCITRTPLCPLA